VYLFIGFEVLEDGLGTTEFPHGLQGDTLADVIGFKEFSEWSGNYLRSLSDRVNIKNI
jgi:hypothetical protein